MTLYMYFPYFVSLDPEHVLCLYYINNWGVSVTYLHLFLYRNFLSEFLICFDHVFEEVLKLEISSPLLLSSACAAPYLLVYITATSNKYYIEFFNRAEFTGVRLQEHNQCISTFAHKTGTYTHAFCLSGPARMA